jgi:hypothetical protein
MGAGDPFLWSQMIPIALPVAESLFGAGPEAATEAALWEEQDGVGVRPHLAAPSGLATPRRRTICHENCTPT